VPVQLWHAKTANREETLPAIYSDEWYQAMKAMANSRDDLSEKVPGGEWRIAVEVHGDGISPYVLSGCVRHYFVRVLDGKIMEYHESSDPIPGKGLNYRVIGPAHVFEGIAAGIVDPMEKALDGTFAIRGDMRLIIQNAELANIIFDVYMQQRDVTEWPKGSPPYA